LWIAEVHLHLRGDHELFVLGHLARDPTSTSAAG
jgi:hypothetical protein